MRGREYQTCPICSAGPVRVFTIPEDLRRFLMLKVKLACGRCQEDLNGQRDGLRRAA